MTRIRVSCFFGTRPEAIKFVSVIKALNEDDNFICDVVVTGQHRELLYQVLDFFKISPNVDFELMCHGQSLTKFISRCITESENYYLKNKPDWILVQGDTVSAYVGALIGFHLNIKVGHIEAGLRSYDLQSPFPEEGYRQMISRISNIHFAPTRLAFQNLLNEKVNAPIHITGNTVIDALLKGVEIVELNEDSFQEKFNFIDFSKKIILVTAHRRESFGEPFVEICKALLEIVSANKDCQIIFPMHYNPNVRGPVQQYLIHDRIKLIEPLAYQDLIYLMKNSYLIITDSGGIQEEAPSLGIPILVIRDVTERMEGVESGTAILVGTDKEKICRNTSTLLRNKIIYQDMANAINPYGDGDAAARILFVLGNE